MESVEREAEDVSSNGSGRDEEDSCESDSSVGTKPLQPEPDPTVTSPVQFNGKKRNRENSVTKPTRSGTASTKKVRRSSSSDQEEGKMKARLAWKRYISSSHCPSYAGTGG